MARVTEAGSGDGDSDGDSNDDSDDVEVVLETVARFGPENGAESIRVLLSGTFGPLPAPMAIGAACVLFLLV